MPGQCAGGEGRIEHFLRSQDVLYWTKQLGHLLLVKDGARSKGHLPQGIHVHLCVCVCVCVCGWVGEFVHIIAKPYLQWLL